jgi:glycosyltransferase involved in cell wall biosynthesis
LNERIRAARAVVFPSVWHEPAGLVTLEAAAHGRAVIAGRAGGIPEYAHEDFAFLAGPHDEDTLAQRITRLAENRELAAAMGRRGMRHAQSRFSMDTFLDQLHAHYTAVINRHHEHLAA